MAEKRDIKRKNAGEKLRAISDRYRSYIEVTGQLAWTTNADGEVEEDIPSWRRYTGQSYKEVKGWGWSEAVHPDDIERVTQIWKKAVATKSSYEVEYRVRRHDGIYRHFLARGVPVAKEDGKVREWVGTSIDITERKKAEEEIKEAAAEWSKTFDAIPDLVFVLDKDYRITKVNKVFVDMLKAKPEDIIGKKCYELLHKRNSTWPGCPSEASAKDKKSHTIEVDDPNIGLPLLVSASPLLDDKGRVTGFVHTAKDMSVIKKAEEAVEKKMRDMERFQKATMGREKMILELKAKVKELEAKVREKS